MKLADDRQQVLFREALTEGRRRNPSIFPPMNSEDNIPTNRTLDSGASHLKEKGKV
jgi:hypothetical protein